MGSVFFAACKKESLVAPDAPVVEEACTVLTANPSGHSYEKDSIVDFDAQGKYCGIMPLSSRNYWVYLDSVYQDGVFIQTKYDTLQFTDTYKSLSDGLIWWESNISVGLPDKFYANDSTFFKMQDRLFVPDIVDAKKEYGLFAGDSVKYLANYDDIVAQGRSVKLYSPVVTPAGSFDDCVYFDKNARNYRRDQVYFKPGVGVLKYIREEAPMGTRVTQLQQVSTLVKFVFR